MFRFDFGGDNDNHNDDNNSTDEADDVDDGDINQSTRGHAGVRNRGNPFSLSVLQAGSSLVPSTIPTTVESLAHRPQQQQQQHASGDYSSDQSSMFTAGKCTIELRSSNVNVHISYKKSKKTMKTTFHYTFQPLHGRIMNSSSNSYFNSISMRRRNSPLPKRL
jgi:hypothetical protein